MAFLSKKYNLSYLLRYIRVNLKKIILIGVFLKVIIWNVGRGNYCYNYSHISEDAIDSVLYKRVIPTILIKERPNCVYEHVLQSTRTVDTWNFPKNINIDDFGIENGSFAPTHCNPVFSVAILVTFRNREKHLGIFLPYLHNFLRKQNIHYKVYLIKQQDTKPFNKGLLYNIGARQAFADGFPCLVLHDIDLLPVTDSNLYACTTQPRHLSTSIDKYRFVLPYYYLVGGVLAIQMEQYVQLNGFSNRFRRWGGEDDDLSMRMKEQYMKIIRFPRSMSRYKSLPHIKSEKNPDRFTQLKVNRKDTTSQRMDDGLQSARAFVRQTNHRLYTLLAVKT